MRQNDKWAVTLRKLFRAAQQRPPCPSPGGTRSGTGTATRCCQKTSLLLAAQFISCSSQVHPTAALYQKFPFSPKSPSDGWGEPLRARQPVEEAQAGSPGKPRPARPGRPPFPPRGARTVRLAAGPAAPPRSPRSFVQLKWLLWKGGSGARAPAGESPRGRAARRGAAGLDTTRPGRRPALRRARPAGGGGPAPLPSLCWQGAGGERGSSAARERLADFAPLVWGARPSVAGPPAHTSAGLMAAAPARLPSPQPGHWGGS